MNLYLKYVATIRSEHENVKNSNPACNVALVSNKQMLYRITFKLCVTTFN